MKKFYVTTPIYYANAKPHLGTLYSTLIADVVNRFEKIRGKNVFFLTGTDEHGQKLQESAKKAGLDPKTFVDSNIPAFKELWKLYKCDYSKFIRTTDKEHVDAVIKFITKLQERGEIYKSSYVGWYCEPCETFVTLVQTSNPTCPTCTRGLKQIEEENYFFRLSAYEDKLLKFYEENPNFISPKERLNEVISFVKSGLQDLSISRMGLEWGIRFPLDPKHAVYVWADALVNYISAIGYANDEKTFAQLWPADLHVMAKDIVRFHAVYWPAFLMAAELPLPKKLLVHGYILSSGDKMSKSRGNVVDALELAQKYGVEQVRYYLMRQMPVNQDGSFDTKDLEQHINADLANNLGNLLNRMLVIATNSALIKFDSSQEMGQKSLAHKMKCEEAVRSYFDNMSHYQFHVALADVWKFASQTNAYFNEMQPWAIKNDKALFEEVIATTANSLVSIAFMLWPILPEKMEELLGCLGQKMELGKDYENILRQNKWDVSFNLKLGKPLFTKIETGPPPVRPECFPKENVSRDTNQPTDSTPTITIDDFAKVELTVGQIIACEPIEGSDKLLKLTVNFGPLGQRQILSGIKKYTTPENLVGKQAVFVTNLAPRKMMGIESHGMLLTAIDSSGSFSVLSPEVKVDSGTKLK